MEYNTDTEVKLITSDLLKSPVLNNSFGSLKDLLKIVLTEGFNEKEVASIVFSQDKDLFIVRLPLNHGYSAQTVVTISGANESQFNKEFRLIEVSGTSASIYISDKSITEATGDLVIKVAPLGYTIPYENEEEGVVCFKNKSLKSPAILKVIDKLPPNGYSDTWAKYARVVIGQSITDQGDFVDNLKSPSNVNYPNAEKTGNGVSGAGGIHGFAKWDYASHSGHDFLEVYPPNNSDFPTNWRIIGDNKTFYLMIQATGRDRYSYNILGYGNYISLNKDESYNVCLQARHGFVNANQHWEYCLLRSANNFGALNWDLSGYLFANVYGIVPKSSGRCRNVGMMFSIDNWHRPWLSSGINNSTAKGDILTSELHIKDSEGYLRGHHRGLKIFYGKSSFIDLLKTNTGSLIVNIQAASGASTSENTIQPLLFSLKNWEEVL